MLQCDLGSRHCTRERSDFCFIQLVIGFPPPAPINMYGLQSSPSVCFLEYILCTKEGLGVLGRLVSRKEGQLKVKRGLRACALLGQFQSSHCAFFGF